MATANCRADARPTPTHLAEAAFAVPRLCRAAVERAAPSSQPAFGPRRHAARAPGIACRPAPSAGCLRSVSLCTGRPGGVVAGVARSVGEGMR